MPELGITVHSPIFANFDPKIGFYGKVPWTIEKAGQIGNLQSDTYPGPLEWGAVYINTTPKGISSREKT